MTALERKVFKFSAIIGSTLTIGVLILDGFGGLNGLENWLYDRRMSDCQFFRKAPTTQIVHIDIDDRSLEIHKWPWPRDMQAAVLQEIGNAGAKVIATDILYSEPAEVVGRTQRDGSMKLVDEDKALAQTMAQMKNVVLPASLLIAPPRSVTELDSALLGEMTGNLELKPEELESHLRIRGFGSDETSKAVGEQFITARRTAMTDRIRQELEQAPLTLPELYKKLIPITAKDISTNPPLKNVLDQQYANVQAWLELSKFAVPQAHLIAPPLATIPEALPLPQLSRVARECGFVDDNLTEPVFRSTPMFVECQGKIFAHWGLQFACALADADINRAVITTSSVTIPSASGDYVIPLRTKQSAQTGRVVRYMADIPWWGTGDWPMMYDFPRYQATVNHLPVSKVWDICLALQNVQHNNEEIDAAVTSLLDNETEKELRLGLDPALAKKYFAALPSVDDPLARVPIIDKLESIIKESGLVESIAQITDATPQEKETKRLLDIAREAIQHAREQNPQLATEIANNRAALRSLVGGKGVLIGSTATGAMDMVTTPLHARCPGVVVHGAIANAFLTRQWWRTAPWLFTAILTVAFGVAVSLATSWLSPLNSVFTAIVTLVAYFAVNGILLFAWGHWIVGAAGPMVAIGLAWAGATVTRLIIEGIERIHVERQRAMFAHEMNLARNVQQALIPKDMPKLDGIEPFGWTKAADETGGDLFDLWTLPDGRLGILVADASGHGLAPSVIVSQVRTLVRALSEIEKHPNGLLARVNARLAQDLEPARFVTAFLGFLDSQGTIEWASAGHGPMLWCTKDGEEFQSLDATALPLGIMEDYMGDEDVPPLRLEISGMLIVTSDGIFEAPNATDEQFGIERVIETLKEYSGRSTLEISSAIRDAVTKWQRDPNKPVDDQTTVIIRRVTAGLNVTIVEGKAEAVPT